MAGKNSRLNRFMQMIGIVDVPQDEADDRGGMDATLPRCA